MTEMPFVPPPYRMQRGDANYSIDKIGIYSLTVIYEERGIFYWDMEKQVYIPIYKYLDEGFINNMQVVHIY